MKKKLLFFDIDGTLLAGGIPGYIPESAIRALKQAQANGHYLFINTGRTKSFIPQQILDFPFDGFVAGCGTEIIFHGETIFHHLLPMEVRRSIKGLMAQAQVQGAYEGSEKCYFDTRPDLDPAIAFIKNQYAEVVGEEFIGSFDDEDLDFDKFVIIGHEQSGFDLFKELISEHFDFIQRETIQGSLFAEIVPKGYSKASAIDFLMDYLGASIDDCYVFGDSTNDLSMLCHVPHSIGMGNSCQEVLDAVSYVTTPVDRDGIEISLKHFQLI